MGNEYQAEHENLRLKSIELWRSRVQELREENRELREENKRLREQRDALAFEAITSKINDEDWNAK